MPNRGLISPDSKEGLSSRCQLLSSDPCVSSLKVSLIDVKMPQLKYDQKCATANHLRL